MPGTTKGGSQAAKTNRERYGEDFYKRIGSKGGKASRNGPFSQDRDFARRMGALGGKKSRRGPSKVTKLTTELENMTGFEMITDERDFNHE